MGEAIDKVLRWAESERGQAEILALAGSVRVKGYRRRSKSGKSVLVKPYVRGGLGSKVVKTLAEAALAGGFTYDRNSKTMPTSGVAVARPGGSSILPATDFDAAVSQLVDYIDKLPDDVSTFGGWFDTEHNELCLDIVDVIPDRNKAIALGRERNQQAVFDLGSLEEIPTGGSGDERKY